MIIRNMFKLSFFWSDCGLISIHHLNVDDERDTGWVLHIFPSASYWGWGWDKYTMDGNDVVDVMGGFLFRYVSVT